LRPRWGICGCCQQPAPAVPRAHGDHQLGQKPPLESGRGFAHHPAVALGMGARWVPPVGGISSHVFDYHYDAAGRLDSVAVDGDMQAGFTYDDNGNQVAWRGPTAADTASATYDAQDRMLRYGNTVYAHAANGELVRRVDASGDTLRTTYDELGNLVGAHVGGDSLAYLSDGLNRRVGRVVNGKRTHTWLYQNDLNVVAELDSNGTLVNRYVYGTRGHVPDLVVREDTTYRLITDHLGSVRAVVNVETGAVAERVEYDAWGRGTLDTNPEFVSLKYAGGLRDPATEFVRFGSRDYDPIVGRWTCKDRIEQTAGDISTYAYGNDAPVCLIDPNGARPHQPQAREEDESDVPTPSEVTKEALAAFADGVIPFWDPFEKASVYRATDENGLCWSKRIGEWTRDIELVLLGSRIRLRYHYDEKPHDVWPWGKIPHNQIDWWIKGLKGSGGSLRWK